MGFVFGCVFNSSGDSNKQPVLVTTAWDSSFGLIFWAGHLEFPLSKRGSMVAAACLPETGAGVQELEYKKSGVGVPGNSYATTVCKLLNLS